MMHAFATDDQIINAYKRGMSIEDIASEFGYTHVSVVKQKINKFILASKIDPTDHYIDHGKIQALRKAGWTVCQIAYEMDMTESEIQKELR